jgi:hypothetical protein
MGRTFMNDYLNSLIHGVKNATYLLGVTGKVPVSPIGSALPLRLRDKVKNIKM